MSASVPFLFYGLIKIGQPEPRRLHLSKTVQERLTFEFQSQRDNFLKGSEAVDYDPQYKPEEGDEHFLLKNYDLPVAFKKVIESPDTPPALEPEDFDSIRVRCLWGMSQDAKKRELIFQNFDSGNVLKRGTGFLARHERFDQLDETAVTLKDRITAYFDGKDLHFRSTNLVSRYLDLDQVFTEATDEEVKAFIADKRFAPANAAALLQVSDAWIRRKVSVINARKILETVSLSDIKRVAEEFQVALETTVGAGGKELIVLPTEKKELKNLLRLFAQDLLQCAMTSDKFRVNSKARIDA